MTDFTAGDRIDLSRVADLEFAEVRVSTSGGSDYIFGDPDRNGTADFAIRVAGSYDIAEQWNAGNRGWLIV